MDELATRASQLLSYLNKDAAVEKLIEEGASKEDAQLAVDGGAAMLSEQIERHMEK